jgi:ketosteroid isomerase-like protein
MFLMNFDDLVKQYHGALEEFVKGNYRPMENIVSHGDAVTLANPFGGISHGWESVAKTLERAASFFRDGTINFENVTKFSTDEVGFLVEFERANAKFNEKEGISKISLRVTSIFHMEDGVWKLVHRQADPLITLQPAESLIQK